MNLSNFASKLSTPAAILSIRRLLLRPRYQEIPLRHTRQAKRGTEIPVHNNPKWLSPTSLFFTRNTSGVLGIDKSFLILYTLLCVLISKRGNNKMS